MSKSISVGVSSCLLGHNVRYDGQNKRHDLVLALCDDFHCVAICPELAIGLGVPRMPVNIIQTGHQQRVRGSADGQLDVTDQLMDYADHINDSMPEICGYIFKSRSPSCGVQSTPCFDEHEKQIGVTSGIYSGRIIQRVPDLPVVEETQLTSESDVKDFANAVRTYWAAKHGVMD